MTYKMKFIDKFLIASVFVFVGIVGSWGIAMARLYNPLSTIGVLTVTDFTFTNATGTNLTVENLTVTVLNTSSQFSYVPVNTTSHAARVMIQGAGTENPFNIVSSSQTSMFRVNTAGVVTINTSGAPNNTTFVLQGLGNGYDVISVISSTAAVTRMLTLSSNGNLAVGTSTATTTFSIHGNNAMNIYNNNTSNTATGYESLKTWFDGANWNMAVSSIGGTTRPLRISSQQGAYIQYDDNLGLALSPLNNKLFLNISNGGYLRPVASSVGMGMRGTQGTQPGVDTFVDGEDTRSATTGTSTQFQARGSFVPTAGTGNWIGTDIVPTINTGGSYNGTYVAALRVSPLLTAATATNNYLLDVGSNALVNGTGNHTSVFNIKTNGNVGLGTTSPQFKLAVTGTVAMANLKTNVLNDNLLCWSTVDGEVTQQATSCVISSARFKENVYSMDSKDLIAKVNKLRAVGFDYKDGYVPSTGKASEGFLAEEVAMIDPLLVVYTDKYTPADLAWEKKNYPKVVVYKDGKALIPQTVDYARVSVLLTGAMQNMDDRLTELESGTPSTQTPEENFLVYVLTAGLLGTWVVMLLKRK